MKFKELKDKTEVELKKLVAANREKLRDLRFKVANKQLKNIRDIRKLKKEVAQALTILNNKNKKN